MSARTLWMQVSRSPCALPRQPCYSPEYSLISCIWHLPQASSDQVCTGKMAAGDCSAVGQPPSICVALGQLPHLRQSSKAGAQFPFEPILDSPLCPNARRFADPLNGPAALSTIPAMPPAQSHGPARDPPDSSRPARLARAGFQDVRAAQMAAAAAAAERRREGGGSRFRGLAALRARGDGRRGQCRVRRCWGGARDARGGCGGARRGEEAAPTARRSGAVHAANCRAGPCWPHASMHCTHAIVARDVRAACCTSGRVGPALAPPMSLHVGACV